jgi:hypothetical protein
MASCRNLPGKPGTLRRSRGEPKCAQARAVISGDNPFERRDQQ